MRGRRAPRARSRRRVRGFGRREAVEPQVALGSSGGAFHPVAGNFRPDDTSLDDCAARSTRVASRRSGTSPIREGAKAALTLFDEQIASDEFVSADCHRIGHVIGSAAFARYEGNVAKTFALGSSTCASGYYHGILERAFVGVNTKTKLVDVARALCDGSGVRRRGFLDYQCRHGLGTRADDPDRVRPSARSVDLCGARDALGRRRLHRRRVHGERDDALRLPLLVALRGRSARPVRPGPASEPAFVLPASSRAGDRLPRQRLREGGGNCAGARAALGASRASGASAGTPPARRVTRPPRSSSSVASRATGGATASSAPRERSATGRAFPARNARPGSVPVLRAPIATRATPASGSSSGCSTRRTTTRREACSKIAGEGAPHARRARSRRFDRTDARRGARRAWRACVSG